jgi:2-isopropylmalate synthase
VLRAEGSAQGPWSLEELTTEARTTGAARALVVLTHTDGRSVEHAASGDGPVDAAFKAIEAATGIRVVLRKFEVKAVSEGEDAQGEARVYVEYNRRTYRGASVSTNIIESATRAFLEVINRIELAQAGTRARAATPAVPAAV